MAERKVTLVPELARLEQAAEILGHLVRADLVARLHFRLANENKTTVIIALQLIR